MLFAYISQLSIHEIKAKSKTNITMKEHHEKSSTHTQKKNSNMNKNSKSKSHTAKYILFYKLNDDHFYNFEYFVQAFSFYNFIIFYAKSSRLL